MWTARAHVYNAVKWLPHSRPPGKMSINFTCNTAPEKGWHSTGIDKLLQNWSKLPVSKRCHGLPRCYFTAEKCMASNSDAPLPAFLCHAHQSGQGQFGDLGEVKKNLQNQVISYWALCAKPIDAVCGVHPPPGEQLRKTNKACPTWVVVDKTSIISPRDLGACKI